jgi:hypothetical protein
MYVPDSITVGARLSNQDIGEKKKPFEPVLLNCRFQDKKKKFASEVGGRGAEKGYWVIGAAQGARRCRPCGRKRFCFWALVSR